jgi:uroporphyrinogen decarboxylase
MPAGASERAEVRPVVESMSKRDRLGATILGEATDRVPWSLWRHYYESESSAEQLATVMVAWEQRYQFDLLKLNPRAQYHVEGWGARYQYSGDPHERPTRLEHVIKKPQDWTSLTVLPSDSGPLGEQLDAIRLTRQGIGPDVPLIETVFLPIMVAGYLAESDTALLQAVQETPESVEQALETIVATFTPFLSRCLEAGADGFFFATTWATPAKLSSEQYERFGRPFDLRLIEAARSAGASTNVLHVCGDGARVFEFADYPYELFSYAATSPGNPSLAQTVGRLPGAVIGGLTPEAVTSSDASLAAEEALAAMKSSEGRRWVLGGACSLPTLARDENLRSAARAVGIALSQ